MPSNAIRKHSAAIRIMPRHIAAWLKRWNVRVRKKKPPPINKSLTNWKSRTHDFELLRAVLVSPAIYSRLAMRYTRLHSRPAEGYVSCGRRNEIAAMQRSADELEVRFSRWDVHEVSSCPNPHPSARKCRRLRGYLGVPRRNHSVHRSRPVREKPRPN